jgi:hypothetical protein
VAHLVIVSNMGSNLVDQIVLVCRFQPQPAARTLDFHRLDSLTVTTAASGNLWTEIFSSSQKPLTPATVGRLLNPDDARWAVLAAHFSLRRSGVLDGLRNQSRHACPASGRIRGARAKIGNRYLRGRAHLSVGQFRSDHPDDRDHGFLKSGSCHLVASLDQSEDALLGRCIRRSKHLAGLEQLPRDQDALDFTGPFADLVDLGVAVVAGHRGLFHEAVAAVNLHGLVGAGGGHL